MEIVTENVVAGSQQLPCFLARPKSGGPYPGLVVVQEAFGLNDNIHKLTARFAAEGFVAIAPNLFFRQGPDALAGYDELPKAITMVRKLSDEEVLSDMAAAMGYLKALPSVKHKFGTTGFCMGGRVAFLTAVRNPEIAASAPFYGGGMATAGAGGKAPIDYATDLKGPVLAFFGGKDAFIPPAEVEKFRAALTASGKPFELVLYPDADHGFMCDERPSYHPAHAPQAWTKVVDFFRTNLA